MRVLLLSLIVVSFSLLVGCQNTAQGLGEDTEQNVKAVRKAVNS